MNDTVIKWVKDKQNMPTHILIITRLGGVAEAEHIKGDGFVTQYRWSIKIPINEILFWSEFPKITKEQI